MKGYDMNDNVVPGEAVDVSTVTGTEAIPEEQEQTLRQLLSYLQENDLNALFFLSPKTMTEQEQRMYHYIGDIVEEYGFTFLNLNDHYEEIGIDFATDFMTAAATPTHPAPKDVPPIWGRTSMRTIGLRTNVEMEPIGHGMRLTSIGKYVRRRHCIPSAIRWHDRLTTQWRGNEQIRF